MLRIALVVLFLHAEAWGVGLRVVTFNIETHRNEEFWPDFALGDPGTVDHDSVAAILGRIDADVVALQEVHTGDLTGSPSSELEQLAATLGLPHIHFTGNSGNFDPNLRVVFLSRYPFLTTDSISSPPGAKEISRYAAAVVVDVPGTDEDPLFVTAHLKSGGGLADRFRRSIEFRRLADYLSAQALDASDNFIILGDLNPSGADKVFTDFPSAMPSTYSLGADISFPVTYSSDVTSYFGHPVPSQLDPRQLDDVASTIDSGNVLDFILVSPGLAGRPYQTEIYNSALDVSNDDGLSKSGSPLASGTSADASDHYPVFVDLQLDQGPFNLALSATAPTVSEGDPDGTLMLTVSLAAPAITPLTMTFDSTDSGAEPFDTELTIPIGGTSATTPVITSRNYLFDGTRQVTFSVTAPGYAAASVGVQLLDSDAGYAFSQSGEVLIEDFDGFGGLHAPAPWTSDALSWAGEGSGGSSIAGARSYGSAGESAVGFLSDGAPMVLETSVLNDSGVPLTILDIAYDAEQWRSQLGGATGGIEVDVIADGVTTPLPDLTFVARTDLPDGAVSGGMPSSHAVRVEGLSVDPGESFDLRFRYEVGPNTQPLPDDVFINEFHYDNTSTDTGEFVEVVMAPGYDGLLSAVELYRYDGNSGGVTGSAHGLDTFIEGVPDAAGYRFFFKEISGIQNGPDGFALVKSGQVVEFVSYEGSFSATNGPAAGATSVDVVVDQSPAGAVGKNAIGRKGSGAVGSDFDWHHFVGEDHSPGEANFEQSLVLPGLPAQGIAIDSLQLIFVEDTDLDGIANDEDPDDDNDGMGDDAELAFGSNPLDPTSKFAVTWEPGAGGHVLSFPGVSGVSYSIEWCDDLQSWEEHSSHLGVDATVIVNLPEGSTRRFFRVRAGE